MTHRVHVLAVLLLTACGQATSPNVSNTTAGLSGSHQTFDTSPLRLPSLGTRQDTFGSLCDSVPGTQRLMRIADAQVIAFAPDLSSVVARVSDSTSVLYDVKTGRQTRLEGNFKTYTADGTRAIFFEQDYPTYQLIDVEAATGKRTVILDGQASVVAKSADNNALIVSNDSNQLWIYFTDTRELRLLVDNKEGLLVSQDSKQTAFVVSAKGGAKYIDAASRTVIPIPDAVSAAFIDGHPTVYYRDAGSVTWAWQPGKSALRLGPEATFYAPFYGALPVRVSAKGETLLLEDGIARLWNVDQHAIREVGRDVIAGVLGPSGNVVLLVRKSGSEKELSLLDLATGQERSVVRLPEWYSAFISPSDRYVVVEDSSTDDIPGLNLAPHAVLGEDRNVVRLFDLQLGQEVPLEAQYTTSAQRSGEYQGYVFAGFHENESVLHVVYGDVVAALFDVATGVKLYESARGVVPNEGYYAFWRPTDEKFYMGGGGYQIDVSDMYVWDASERVEHSLGSMAKMRCSLRDQDVFYENSRTYHLFDNPLDLAAWDYRTNQKRTLGTGLMRHAECLGDRVLFLDGASQLTLADVPASSSKVLSKAAKSFLFDNEHVVYSTPTSICAAGLK